MDEQKKKILIVEDDEGFRDIVKTSFQGTEFETITAEDGEEGLKKEEEEHPDLILMDIMMPKMNGIQMAKKLKKDGITVPIIYLTNANDEERISEVMEMGDGNVDYVVKTEVRIGDIIERIRKRLTKNQPT